ncbi:di-trans,poly-cis-decaprenylcistransferase [Psittacicella melopsittaci]|uniref:Ditrans,polycis-undecaprenyl-diphosphate synthase ((2E,6E)-farnesyl-diphosphate specific) n=1 Tax=Psittacicella melopsittaci TaxID=2028576 RepID=A0A3A1Y423_9GAMM|nr:polyprenyl diphosphate synthase [Psittacicella melopsittaci]RIY33072.1 di-trans,poly-cis-decaprenylcistransferase [Psittacicella melopsittaci]
MQNNNANLPQHVAIIMDGSRRWAKEKNKSQKSGHNAGALAVRRTIEHASNLGIKSLSLYAFSKENWKRPKEEVEHLMKLFLRVLVNNQKFLKKNNIKFTPIGDIKVFSPELQKKLQAMVEESASNTGLNLNVALNYSGRWDITNATAKVLSLALDELKNYLDDPQVMASKIEELKTKYSDEMFLTNLIEENLTVTEQDPIDLIIRTSNEQRISNFFLWQAAYSEFVFLEEYWPEFNAELFDRALNIFSKRVRRFGGV